jgi:hypothetical protein
VLGGVGKQGHIASLLNRCAQTALVFGTSASFAAWFDLATIRNEALHEAARIFIVDLANMIMAELTSFAAGATLTAPTFAAWARSGCVRTSLHCESPSITLEGMFVQISQIVAVVAGATSRRPNGLLILGSEHLHIGQGYLDGQALYTFSIGVFALTQASFDVYLRAFMEVRVACLGELTPGDNAEPVCFTLALTATIAADDAIDGKAKLCQRCAIWKVAHLWIRAQIPDQHNLVHISNKSFRPKTARLLD